MAEEESLLYQPFGPTIFKVKIPEKIIQELNNYIDTLIEDKERLKKLDIPTAIYYPIPLHLQTAFAKLGYQRGDFPVSESTSERILSLPMHPYLTESDIKKITSLV